ncbi:hypothetical protein BYT27DRAFT_7081586 [Phlegmacium glaucopus]|nr:hypothetical protein BYT27DRAFT_7081586 [Phlegmacium glaucopus]
MDLRRYELSKGEWKIAGQLGEILLLFKDATLFFSRGSPNIAMVIPAMDHLDQHLATCALKVEYAPSIRAAVTLGKWMLNKYYDMTDYSEVYRIAMVLHPQHKLTYFKKAGWDNDWIKTARQIVRDEFERSYKSITKDSDDDVETNVAKVHCFLHYIILFLFLDSRTSFLANKKHF